MFICIRTYKHSREFIKPTKKVIKFFCLLNFKTIPMDMEDMADIAAALGTATAEVHLHHHHPHRQVVVERGQ